jgi:protein TonB
MPAYARQAKIVRPRERICALAAVVLIQAGLGFALLHGLQMHVTRAGETIQRLVEVTLAKPPPPLPIEPPKAEHRKAAAPKAEPARPGGSPGPQLAHAPPSVAPLVVVKPSAAPSGGGMGTGPALGAGAGGGAGGNGYGDDGGGTDLEQIAGEITPRDYPRALSQAGVGGHVQFTFTVLSNGRVGRCTITRSSGVPELDALTCRLIQQRFVYRPSTDRYGRPIADEVDGEHEWVARGR